MTTSPVDPRMAFENATAQDLVQKKIAVDALRKRLGDTSTHDQKLREACDGFESIFVQKMWEQMRKNVKKEGYLHSKDEEAYQSMFDVELAKKMTSAGGIGLSDMLFEQLGQRLSKTARGTPGGMRQPIEIASAGEVAKQEQAKADLGNLYTPMEQEPVVAKAPVAPVAVVVEQTPIDKALAEMKRELEDPAKIAAQIAPPASPPPVDSPPQYTVQPMPAKVSAPGKARPVHKNNPMARSRMATSNNKMNVQSGPGAAPVMNALQRPGMPVQGQAVPSAAPVTAPIVPEGSHTVPSAAIMTPGEQAAQWPAPGPVSSGYGWQNTNNGRSWHPGVDIQAQDGDAVKAVLSGTVAFAGQKEGIGNVVILEHEGGYKSFYGNAVAMNVAEGSRVEAGKEFARVSMSAVAAGEKTPPHVHFEMRRGELALNPQTAMAQAWTDTGTATA